MAEASWNEVFTEGFDLWIDLYRSKEKYYKYEGNLCISLLKCFQKVAKDKNLSLEGIQQEKTIVGNTRVDFLLGNEVSFEVKFEPDYPDMPITRKPVTNVVLKTVDIKVAKHAGLEDKEAQMRLYEVELDFLKLMAHKNMRVPYNHLLCLDENGRLHRSLHKSFKTQKVKKLTIPWRLIRRGTDNQEVYYFLWQP